MSPFYSIGYSLGQLIAVVLLFVGLLVLGFWLGRRAVFYAASDWPGKTLTHSWPKAIIFAFAATLVLLFWWIIVRFNPMG